MGIVELSNGPIMSYSESDGEEEIPGDRENEAGNEAGNFVLHPPNFFRSRHQRRKTMDALKTECKLNTTKRRPIVLGVLQLRCRDGADRIGD